MRFGIRPNSVPRELWAGWRTELSQNAGIAVVVSGGERHNVKVRTKSPQNHLAGRACTICEFASITARAHGSQHQIFRSLFFTIAMSAREAWNASIDFEKVTTPASVAGGKVKEQAG